jgi:hypothetical protein
MMGVEAPETCWATHKRQVLNLWNCCIWLVNLFELSVVNGNRNFGKFGFTWRRSRMLKFGWLKNAYERNNVSNKNCQLSLCIFVQNQCSFSLKSRTRLIHKKIKNLKLIFFVRYLFIFVWSLRKMYNMQARCVCCFQILKLLNWFLLNGAPRRVVWSGLISGQIYLLCAWISNAIFLMALCEQGQQIPVQMQVKLPRNT